MDLDSAADLVIVLTTVPTELDVEAFGRALVEQGVAACVNVLPPMRSIYRWQGSIETADERQIVIKTTRGQVTALEQAVAGRHPYEVPEFLVVAVSAGSSAYARWVRESVERQPPGAQAGD